MRGRWLAAGMIICWIGVGCSEKNQVPSGILPLEKMEQVMWDMAQADQFAAMYVAKDSAHVDRKEETMKLYAEVYRLHDVTPDEFRKSYRYYLDHPALNQMLFDSVQARGNRARTEMYDRSMPYRAIVPPRPGAGPAVVPGKAGAVPPVGMPRTVVPGIPAGPAGEAIRRAREAMAKRQDSIARARHLKKYN